MTRPAILIITFSRVVADARVRKQLAVLTEKYDVTTCCYGPPPAAVAGHIEIPADLVYWQKSRLDLILRRYGRAYWDSPAVAWISANIKPGDFDLVWANDLDTVPLALSLRPRRGVHADLHEYAPREKEDVWRWRIFVAPFQRWMARRFLPQVASITTAWKTISTEYHRWLGLDSVVVENASPYADLPVGPVPSTGPFRLVHSGIARPDRQLEVMIAAAGASVHPWRFDLYLTGDPADPYRAALVEAAAAATAGAAHQLTEIRICDPVTYDELIPTLNGYDVGIHCLPPVNFNNKWALPNKFFDYIQARLALVMAPAMEVKDRTAELGVGVVAAGFDAPALTAALDSLDPAQLAAFKAASAVAAPRVSAEHVTAAWAQAVAKLLPV